MKMQITLSPKEVQDIVKEHLLTKFKTVGEIKLTVGQELRGHQMNEHYESVFKGVTCEVDL